MCSLNIIEGESSSRFYVSFYVGEVAKLFADSGVICIASLISPYRRDRDSCRALLPESSFVEVGVLWRFAISWWCHWFLKQLVDSLKLFFKGFHEHTFRDLRSQGSERPLQACPRRKDKRLSLGALDLIKNVEDKIFIWCWFKVTIVFVWEQKQFENKTYKPTM